MLRIHGTLKPAIIREPCCDFLDRLSLHLDLNASAMRRFLTPVRGGHVSASSYIIFLQLITAPMLFATRAFDLYSWSLCELLAACIAFVPTLGVDVLNLRA